MHERLFQNGDRVRIRPDFGDSDLWCSEMAWFCGKEGVVKYYDSSDDTYLVDFPQYDFPHYFDNGAPSAAYWFEPWDLTLIDADIPDFEAALSDADLFALLDISPEGNRE